MLDVMITWTTELVHHVAALAPGDPSPGGPTIPNPGQGAEPPFGNVVTTLLKWGMWGAFSLCVAGFIIIGARMGIQHKRGEGGGHMASLAITGFACALIATAYTIVTQIVASAGG
ncbi:hypothetical protein GCM10010191_03520 [Actinomadura vinacea]|uniref:DUF4190 domain-containing protein n=1 Tax=Actinomadura vinacea TaxID=115336 RepID=A0ABN3IB23_9ACTN